MTGRAAQLVEVAVCVALYRQGRWLLTMRGPHVDHAPGTIGLVGGHVEFGHPEAELEVALLEPDVLEHNARREVLEETGIDLTDVPLRYLGNESFRSDAGPAVLAVTFVAEVLPGVEASRAAPEEATDVGWWTLTELEAEPHCPPWTLRLCRQAAEAIA